MVCDWIGMGNYDGFAMNENSKKWMAAYPELSLAEMWLMAYIWDSGGGPKTTEGFKEVIESYLNARDNVPADRRKERTKFTRME